jgi:putative ABC transport system permease protein
LAKSSSTRRSRLATASVGDQLDAGGVEWKIVGVSEGGDFVASQTVFVNLSEAQAALQMDNAATFLGLRLYRGFAPELVADEAEENQPGIVAFTGDEFAEATRDRILDNILPILTMVLGLAFIVGLAVSGLTIYTSTIEKAREYGILKAVGFKNLLPDL